jgi:ankyrin repeat protein
MAEIPLQVTKLSTKLTSLALSLSSSLLFMDSFDASREIPWEIECSSSSTSSSQLGGSPKSVAISSLLIAQDWEGALSIAEDDPQHAKEWFYGVDDHLDPTIDVLNNDALNNEDEENRKDINQCVVWKRQALHLACVYRAPVGLVEVLLEAYPQAATSSDPHCGSLPIHLACQNKASYRVVKSLLLHSPVTAKVMDKRGRLPLHYAVIAKAHYPIVELLLEVDPSAALAADRFNQTPLDLAKQTHGRRNVIVRLLEMVTTVSSGRRKKRKDNLIYI